jgi:hypothetical protein
MLLDDLGEQCEKCGCFHDDAYEKHHDDASWLRWMCDEFDPDFPCFICGQPVVHLSGGGPEICPRCDIEGNSYV